jgi:UDP-glucose 4-epimerase
MKAFVTGVAGFIGSTLADRLLRDGADVIGIDSFSDYYPREIKQRNLETLLPQARFRFIESRLQDAELRSLIADRTHVFHLAAQAGVRKSWGTDFTVYTVNNIEATQMLLEACVGQPLQRLIYSSSSSVYGDNVPIPMREDALPQPVSPYGVSKLAAEQLCYLYHVNYGVPAVSLRYFTVYGPRQRPDMGFHRFLRATLQGQPITVFGDGEQTRDFTYVANVVDGVLRACEAPKAAGEVINVACGTRISLNELLRVMNGIVGTNLDAVYEDERAGDVKDSQADISKAQAILGYTPTVGLEEGLRYTLAWCRSESAAAAGR